MYTSLNVPFEDGFEVVDQQLKFDPDFERFHRSCVKNKIPLNIIFAGLKFICGELQAASSTRRVRYRPISWPMMLESLLTRLTGTRSRGTRVRWALKSPCRLLRVVNRLNWNVRMVRSLSSSSLTMVSPISLLCDMLMSYSSAGA